MTASHHERRTTHFLKELGWRGNKNSMCQVLLHIWQIYNKNNGLSFQLLYCTGQNMFKPKIQFLLKKLQKVSYREETFHDHKADKISNLEYSHVSIFGIFHPFTSNFLIGIACKPPPIPHQQQKSHFERREDLVWIFFQVLSYHLSSIIPCLLSLKAQSKLQS